MSQDGQNLLQLTSPEHIDSKFWVKVVCSSCNVLECVHQYTPPLSCLCSDTFDVVARPEETRYLQFVHVDDDDDNIHYCAAGPFTVNRQPAVRDTSQGLRAHAWE